MIRIFVKIHYEKKKGGGFIWEMFRDLKEASAVSTAVNTAAWSVELHWGPGFCFLVEFIVCTFLYTLALRRIYFLSLLVLFLGGLGRFLSDTAVLLDRSLCYYFLQLQFVCSVLPDGDKIRHFAGTRSRCWVCSVRYRPGGANRYSLWQNLKLIWLQFYIPMTLQSGD